MQLSTFLLILLPTKLLYQKEKNYENESCLISVNWEIAVQTFRYNVIGFFAERIMIKATHVRIPLAPSNRRVSSNKVTHVCLTENPVANIL